MSELTAQLPGHVQVQEVPCRTIFRFGNSSTVECNRALLVPLGPYKVKICVVPSRTPFLLSNNVFRKLDASIHTATDSVYFGKLGFGLPLTLSEKEAISPRFCTVDFTSPTNASQTDRNERRNYFAKQ